MTLPFRTPGVLALLAVSACAHSSPYTTLTWNPVVQSGTSSKFVAFVEAQLDSVRQADPEADARARMKAGDSAFVALQGYGPIVPGYMEGWKPLLTKHGMRVIEPQCEVIYVAQQDDFCQAASAYAKLYNTTIARSLTNSAW